VRLEDVLQLFAVVSNVVRLPGEVQRVQA
jgi:hypothetical protein